MCGIVGLFLKDAKLEPSLGELTSSMLSTMCERGPDSAGFAVYGATHKGKAKITLQSPDPDRDFASLTAAISKAIGADVSLERKSTHGVLTVPADKVAAARDALRSGHPELRIMGSGEAIEIYKEVGYPTEVASRFDLTQDEGLARHRPYPHGDRDAPSPRMGAHPFSTGPDQCLVHNGSLSNHHNLRRELIHDGMTFETENDTEVAAAYITWRMNQGMNLGEALQKSLDDLDGFFTFVVGTKNGFARAARSDRLQAGGHGRDRPIRRLRLRVSRAGRVCPASTTRAVWEPEPATVYFWER